MNNMSGKVGAPRKVHQKTIDRIRIAIRLQMQNLGLPDSAIAKHLGMTQTSYSILKKTKIYQQFHSQYMTGILAPIDNEIHNTYNENRKILDSAVPQALENLVFLAAQKVDKKLMFEASKEVLDRQGQYAKVSRMGAALPEQGGVAGKADNDSATELIKALAEAKRNNTGTNVTDVTPPVTSEPDLASIPVNTKSIN
jgi:hypothetical protein